MADAEDIIDYIRALKKGFDKDEFKEKIEELSRIVDDGLQYEDFHALFKLWLNLSIPVTKWMSIGVCLVPTDRVEARTIQYAMRWLLANYQNQTSFSRIGFLLDWLTVAMDSDSVDIQFLDTYYVIFYMLLSYEVLTPHAMKLVYNLSKPIDVTRRRVVDLFDIVKKREVKKSKCRQIEALLGLFKSYKPECVPENVPAFSVHTVFRKPNANLLRRFGKSQAQRNSSNTEKQRLLWVNPFNMKSGKAVPLVPNMHFDSVGSKQYSDKLPKKTFFDFDEPAALVEYSLRHELSRPARLRALLCNETAMTLLATAGDSVHAFLSHDLHQLLVNCFLSTSPYSYAEKQDLLRRLGVFQRTIMQGIPVVTRFLAQYIPLWNERDYFHEILDLVEWLSIDSPSHLPYILRPLAGIYHRAQPLEQCAILKCLANLYANLAYASSRQKQYFMSMPQPHNYSQFLSSLAEFVAGACTKALQVRPDDSRVQYWSIWCWQHILITQHRHSILPRPAPTLLFALPMLGASAGMIDKLALMIILYKKIYGSIRKESTANNRKMEDQAWTMQALAADLISSLWSEAVFSQRQTGLVFSKLNPQVVERLSKCVPNADGTLSLRSHVAFAPYTYTQVEAADNKDLDNKFLFETVIGSEFPYLSRFLTRAVPELQE